MRDLVRERQKTTSPTNLTAGKTQHERGRKQRPSDETVGREGSEFYQFETAGDEDIALENERSER